MYVGRVTGSGEVLNGGQEHEDGGPLGESPGGPPPYLVPRAPGEAHTGYPATGPVCFESASGKGGRSIRSPMVLPWP